MTGEFELQSSLSKIVVLEAVCADITFTSVVQKVK